MKDIDVELAGSLGGEFGKGLRQASGYNNTQREFEESGLTDKVLNQTPPVGVNLRILSEMPSVQKLAQGFGGRPLRVAMLGLSIVDGVIDFRRFVNSVLQTSWGKLWVVEIDPEMVQQVVSLEEPDVVALLRDARDTGIESNSIDLVLRDHLGNCCPPEIDRAIDKEATRILRPEGISIVNITTSELMRQSPGRAFISSDQLKDELGNTVVHELQTEIYDLEQLTEIIGRERAEKFRGPLLEIELGSSFVVFGEDPQGHGEWFRPLMQHLTDWERDGFSAIDSKTRDGNDSHNPPLRCLRHNFISLKE